MTLKNTNMKCSECGRETRNIIRIMGIPIRLCKKCESIALSKALKRK